MANKWNQHVMETYRALKKKNPSVKLGAAMKAAKKTWKSTSSSVKAGGKRRKTRRHRR